MLAVFASLPILLVLVLMAGFNWPAKRVMPIGRAAAAARNQYGLTFDVLVHRLGVYTAIIPAVEAGALKEDSPQIGELMAWLPYVLVDFILVITRIPALDIKQLPTMPAPTLAWNGILGSSLAYSLQPLCLPFSVPFLLIAALTIFMHIMNGKTVRATRGNCLKQMVPAAIAPAAA